MNHEKLLFSYVWVSNTDQVLGLVKRNPHVSVFSIGIGQNVSQDLFQGFYK